MLPLSQFAANKTSQFGEDGIIAEIMSRLNIYDQRERWCVEFGAWDGRYLSNTYTLLKENGFKGVLIEADPIKAKALQKEFPGKNVFCLNRLVGFEKDDCLDIILSTTPIPVDFDFLSIDIDGCDYHVWDALRDYRPKVVCIEFNPTIPIEVCYIQPRDFSVKHGSGIGALQQLAVKKGYRLVASTHCNGIFVREDLCHMVVDQKSDVKELCSSTKQCFVFVGYDGTLITHPSEIALPWHGVSVPSSSIQVLPSLIRRYPRDFLIFQRLLFSIWKRFFSLRRRLLS